MRVVVFVAVLAVVSVVSLVSTVDAFAVLVPAHRSIWPKSTAAFGPRKLSFGLSPQRHDRHCHYHGGSVATGSTTCTVGRLYASLNVNSSPQQHQQRRDVLLSRTGPHFKLDRFSGRIEFGATANLVTQLDTSGSSSSETATTTTTTDALVQEWLLDAKGMAMSIWDPQLIQDKGNSIYRLQIMTLQFVTLTLAPWVDVQMQTTLVPTSQNRVSITDTSNNGETIMPAATTTPVFTLQSVAFDPNIQILPGMRLNAKDLGIVIEVVGTLQPSTSSASSSSGSNNVIVSGGIAFQTTGTLPPPMRLLPEALLKATSDSINNTIVQFAIRSFQTGARSNFRDFLTKCRATKKAT